MALRPRGSATRAHTVPTWHIYDIYLIYYIYINGSSAFPRWEGLLTLKIVGYYKPDDFLFYLPCGTNPHAILTFQVTWHNEERRIGGASKDPRVDRVDTDHPI